MTSPRHMIALERAWRFADLDRRVRLGLFVRMWLLLWAHSVTEKRDRRLERVDRFWLKWFVPAHERAEIALHLGGAVDYNLYLLATNRFAKLLYGWSVAKYVIVPLLLGAAVSFVAVTAVPVVVVVTIVSMIFNDARAGLRLARERGLSVHDLVRQLENAKEQWRREKQACAEPPLEEIPRIADIDPPEDAR